MPTFLPQYAPRPGQVTELRGIVFQNDGQSAVGHLFIRPFEILDRWIVGALPAKGEPPLAMHCGIHLVIDGRQDVVAEQLVGSAYLDFKNGLNWTPYPEFKARNRGGWDVTVPATAFRQVDQDVAREALSRLNTIQGHPFAGEDCTAFVERAFGSRRLFADSPVLRSLGIAARIGDPALPLLKPDAALDARAQRLLQVDKIKDLPDAQASAGSPNIRTGLRRVLPLLSAGALVAGTYAVVARVRR